MYQFGFKTMQTPNIYIKLTVVKVITLHYILFIIIRQTVKMLKLNITTNARRHTAVSVHCMFIKMEFSFFGRTTQLLDKKYQLRR